MPSRPMMGGKAERLVRLRAAGFPVPPFVAFDGGRVARTAADGGWEALAREATAAVGAKSYAVRSSAAAEDAADASLAGAFTTEVGVAPDGVAKAMASVAADAAGKLKGRLEGFGIIVQAFVEPDIAGVTFTRHPAGGRETVVEWHEGRGDRVVSGRVTPRSVAYYRNGTAPSLRLPAFGHAMRLFLDIEKSFGAPQDIEWCVSGGRWWIVQSRPITTRSPLMDEADAALDAGLPAGDFIFEKTGTSEIAPRPCTLTLDLLRFVHAPDGPIARAYGRLGIRYADTRPLRIVGNELYVDRDAEVRSLLPAFGRVGRAGYASGPARIAGLWTSLRAMARLGSLPVPDPAQEADRLAALLVPPRHGSFAEALDDLSGQYETVFRTNLFAEKSVAELQSLARPWGGSVAALLSGPVGSVGRLTPPKGLVGNGFDLSDSSEFAWSPSSSGDDAASDREIGLAPPAVRERVRTAAVRARAFSRLREAGRWLTVRLATQLRDAAHASAKVAGWKDAELVTFSTLDEMLSGRLDRDGCRGRQEDWEHWNRHSFPRRLTGTVEATPAGKTIGLSAGMAEGPVVQRADIANANAKVILAVTDLTPDLVDLFGSVQGIITQNGGLLSHCAIVARERHLPVVAGADMTAWTGKRVRIDGTSGTIQPL